MIAMKKKSARNGVEKLKNLDDHKEARRWNTVNSSCSFLDASQGKQTERTGKPEPYQKKVGKLP